MSGPLIGLSAIALCWILLHPLTVLVHELRHAVVARLLGATSITIFIGSYGEYARTFLIQVFGFRIFLTKNPLRWQFGCCMTVVECPTVRKEVLLSLAGPFASLILAIISLTFASLLDDYDGVRLLIFAFVALASFDFVSSILPYSLPADNGGQIHTDGKTVLLHALGKHRSARWYSPPRQQSFKPFILVTHYQTLGISPSATEEEIRRAYRREALRWHPDRNQNNPTAHHRFLAVQEAYAVLSKTQERVNYDIVLRQQFV